MLINTNTGFKKDDIVTIKNTLGEEIICKFVSESDTKYTISNPVALGMTQQGMQFMPVVMSGVTKGELEFQKIHTMWIALTEAELEAAYVQQTTGIAMPEKPGNIIT